MVAMRPATRLVRLRVQFEACEGRAFSQRGAQGVARGGRSLRVTGTGEGWAHGADCNGGTKERTNKEPTRWVNGGLIGWLIGWLVNWLVGSIWLHLVPSSPAVFVFLNYTRMGTF